MGRQCFVGETLVATPDGYTNIEKLEVGDLVLSSDGYKKIINTWQYGVDTDPKPILQFTVDNEKITTTYDHKFYSNGDYVPLYQLAWGAMATSDREQLKLLCEQYGQPFDYEEARKRGLDISDEASGRWFWISENGGGRQDNQDAPLSSSELGREPREETRSEPHKSHKDGQPSGKPRMGNSSGEHTPFSQSGQSSQQTGREQRDAYSQRKAGIRDTGDDWKYALKADSRKIRSIVLHDLGHQETEYLVSSVTVHQTVETYAIDVEDTHDYCITTKNILVGNSGKTYFATNHSWLSAVLDQGRYFVVFKTYKQAHEVVWRQYVPLIPKELIFKKNEQDLLIELNYIKGPVTLPDGTTIEVNHDVTKPRSTIQLLGSDQADSHRGFRANGIIFDEYADQDPNNWDAVYKHFFTTTNGWAIFMGTPRGYNHFYDLIQFAKENDRWFYQEATWRDSPYVSKEFIAEERAEAEKQGKLSTFLQEVELEFRAVQGAVYPDFDRKVHVIKPSEVPEDLTIYAGIDFGYHTTACVLVGIDKDQNWYVYDEVYARESILKDTIPRIKDKLGDQRLVLMVGDSQAKDAIETMALQFPIVPVVKRGDSIIHGIDLIRTKLKPRIQLVGDPKPTLFISSVCKNFIKEMEAYKYPEDKPDRNPSELPMKEDDHGPDALRYLVLHLKYGVNNQNDKFPKPAILKETNSYGLL